MMKLTIDALSLNLNRLRITHDDLAIALKVDKKEVTSWFRKSTLTEFRYFEIIRYLASISAQYDHFGHVWVDGKVGYIVRGGEFATYDKYGFHFTPNEEKAVRFENLVAIMRAENILKSKDRFRKEEIKRLYLKADKTPTFKKEKI